LRPPSGVCYCHLRPAPRGMMIMEDPEKSVRLAELAQIEQEERDRAVRIALGKFNFVLHTSMWLSGCAFLLVLGLLMRSALPWLMIPVALWTAALACHGYRAFVRTDGKRNTQARSHD